MPEYKFKETKLICPKCGKGKVRLVISRKEGKEYKFFRCSEYDCDWNGGFYNQDNNKIGIIDNCPSCDGVLYVRNGKNGPFLGCSHFPECKQTRKLTEDESKLLESLTEKTLDEFIGEKDPSQEQDNTHHDSPSQEKDNTQHNFPSQKQDTAQKDSTPQDNSDDSNKEKPVYERIKTDLKCPECEKGDVVLIIKTTGNKETKFFRCTEEDCHWNGGFYNRDEIKTDVLEHCPSCNGIVYEKIGRKGPFMACSNFPKCKYTRNIEKMSDDEDPIIREDIETSHPEPFEEDDLTPIETIETQEDTATTGEEIETQEDTATTGEEIETPLEDSEITNENVEITDFQESREETETDETPETIQESSEETEKEETTEEEKPKAYERFETKLLCPECMEGQVILIRNMDTGKGFFRCTNNDCDWDGGPYSQPLIQLKHITYCQEPECKGINYHTEGKFGPYKACTWFSKTGCRPKKKR